MGLTFYKLRARHAQYLSVNPIKPDAFGYLLIWAIY